MPFMKPPDMQRMLTAMPRAILHFVLHNSSIPAKPINDQQNLQLVINLPANFAYRMIDCEITIIQDVAFAWQFGAELQVSSALRGLPTNQILRHSLTATESFSFSPITQQVHYVIQRIPTYIMQGPGGLGFAPLVDFRMVNNTAPAGAAGTVSCLMRFYEFDIEQVQMFPPLVPGALTYQVGP